MISLKRNNFCGTHEGAKYWLNTEICGIFCGCVTYVLVLFGQYALSSLLLATNEWNQVVVGINLVLFNSFSGMAMYSHFKAMTTDPGAVPRGALPLLDDQQEHDYEAGDKRHGNRYRKFCKRCNAFKPIRAHHCSICRRCIVKMDHHCPWVNNCVGLGNHKLFLQFLSYVNIISVHAIIIIVVKYANCTHFGTSCGSPTDHLYAILCFIESLLFGLFTCCMKCDQISNINNNSTQIDRMQNIYHDAPVEEIHEVLGTHVGVTWDWTWILPIPANYPSSVIRDQIFGYTLPLVQQQQHRRSSRRHSGHHNAAVVDGNYYLQEDDDDGEEDEGNIEMRPLRGHEGAISSYNDKTVSATISTTQSQISLPLLPMVDTGAGVGVVVDAAVAVATAAGSTVGSRGIKMRNDGNGDGDDDSDEERPNYNHPIGMMFTDQFRHVDQRNRQKRRNIPPLETKEEEISGFDSYGVNTPLISNNNNMNSPQNEKGSPPLSGREGSNSSDSISDRDRYYTMRKRLP